MPADALFAHTRPAPRTLTALAAAAVVPFAADRLAAQQTADSAVAADTLRVEVARLAAGGIPLARAPFGAHVIAGAALARLGAATAAHALARLPGVTLADELGSALQPDLAMRGFGASPVVGLPQGISVFVDGVRVNEPDASQVNFDLIPLADVERIEMVRGPSGPFGKNALGGAINLVTRRGGAAGPAAVEASAGTLGSAEVHAFGAGRAGPLDYYASGRYLRDSGWREAAHARTAHLFTKVGWRSQASDVWVSYTFAADSILQAGSLPLSWLRDGAEVPGRWAGPADPRTINFTGGDYFGPRLHFLSARLARRLGPATRLEASTFARANDVIQFNANFTEPDIRLDTETLTLGATAQISWAIPVLELLGGLEYARSDVGILIFEHPNANFPAIDPSGERLEDVGTLEHDAAAFAQARLAAGSRVALTGTLRYDHVALPFRDFLEPANDGDNTFQQVTGGLGIDVVPGPGIVTFASYGRGFRAPVLMELACADPADPCPLPYELGADPPLDPVTTDTWQAGLRLFRGDALEAELVAFWAEVYDDIFNVQPAGARVGYFQNLDRTRRRGLEAALAWRPLTQVRLSGNVAYTRATFETAATLTAPYRDHDDNRDPAEGAAAGPQGQQPPPPSVRPGDSFPMTPIWRANLAAELRTGAWTLGLHAAYVGGQWLRGDEDNTQPELRLDPYSLVDARASRTLGALTAFAEVSNLLDTDHVTFGVLALNRLNAEERVEPFVTPGLPRRLRVGLRWQLR